MKRILTILAFSIALFSCKKEKNENCFKVKYIDGMCSTKIYQILDSNYTFLGEDNYVMAKDGKVYDNVFTQSNYCENITLDANGIGKVTLDAKEPDFSCITCLALYPKQPPIAFAVSQCSSFR